MEVIMFFINDYSKVLSTSIVTLHKACKYVNSDLIAFTAISNNDKIDINWFDVWFFLEKDGVTDNNIIECVKQYKRGGILEDELGFENDDIKEIIFTRLNGKDVNISVKF